jgi:ribosomal protein S18 acetylase RimI-like enzyme
MLTRATDADVPAIVELMNVAFRATGPGASWNSEADIIDGDRTTEELLRAELGEKPGAALFVWRTDPAGAIQGCVSLEPAAEGVWYLGTLSVDPRLQNSGFGRRLLTAAEERAAGEGATVIRLKVVNARDALIAWYVRRGYRLTGETLPFPYDDRRFGTPRRDDLTFVILDKAISAR